jgi:hypothetical protein
LIESSFTGVTGLVATAALPAFAALPLPLATGTFVSGTFVSGTFVSGTLALPALLALPVPTATLALPALLALPLPVALALPDPAALATALPLPVVFALPLPLSALPLLTVATLLLPALLPLPSCFARSAENPPLTLGLDELPVAPNVTGSVLPPLSQPLAAITASTIHRVIIFLYPKKDCERRLREESSLA